METSPKPDLKKLLREHLKHPDRPQAFTALVSQLQGLVYQSALRRCSNAEIAAEVSQKVFTILAHKASWVMKHPSPYAWLFLTTKLETLKTMRRQRREFHKRSQYQEVECTAVNETKIAELRAVLDQALDQLPAPDRELVLMKYYEGRTHPEIENITGRGESANKMRLKRALTNLSTWLQREGVTLSLTALGAGLSTEFAKASPLTAQSLATNSLAQSATLSSTAAISNTISTMSPVKTISSAIALTFALSSIPLGWQFSQANSLAQEIASFENDSPLNVQLPNRQKREISNHSRNRPIQRLLTESNQQLDIHTFTEGIKEFLATNDMIFMMKIMLPLSQMSEIQLEKFHAKFNELEIDKITRSIGNHTLSQLMNETSGHAKIITQQIRNGESISSYFNTMKKWATQDPEAAAAWLTSERDALYLQRKGTNLYPLRTLKAGYLAGLAQDHPDKALSYFSTMDNEDHRSVIRELMNPLTRYHFEKASKLAKSITEPETREFALHTFTQVSVQEQALEKIIRHFSAQHWSQSERHAAYTQMLVNSPELSQKSINEKLAWAANHTPEKSESPYLESIIHDAHKKERVDQWLDIESNGKRKDQALMVCAESSVTFENHDADSAARYVRQISSPETRAHFIQKLLNRIKHRPQTAARFKKALQLKKH